MSTAGRKHCGLQFQGCSSRYTASSRDYSGRRSRRPLSYEPVAESGFSIRISWVLLYYGVIHRDFQTRDTLGADVGRQSRPRRPWPEPVKKKKSRPRPCAYRPPSAAPHRRRLLPQGPDEAEPWRKRPPLEFRTRASRRAIAFAPRGPLVDSMFFTGRLSRPSSAMVVSRPPPAPPR